MSKAYKIPDVACWIPFIFLKKDKYGCKAQYIPQKIKSIPMDYCHSPFGGLTRYFKQPASVSIILSIMPKWTQNKWNVSGFLNFLTVEDKWHSTKMQKYNFWLDHCDFAFRGVIDS